MYPYWFFYIIINSFLNRVKCNSITRLYNYQIVEFVLNTPQQNPWKPVSLSNQNWFKLRLKPKNPDFIQIGKIIQSKIKYQHEVLLLPTIPCSSMAAESNGVRSFLVNFKSTTMNISLVYRNNWNLCPLQIHLDYHYFTTKYDDVLAIIVLQLFCPIIEQMAGKLMRAVQYSKYGGGASGLKVLFSFSFWILNFYVWISKYGFWKGSVRVYFVRYEILYA